MTTRRDHSGGGPHRKPPKTTHRRGLGTTSKLKAGCTVRSHDTDIDSDKNTDTGIDTYGYRRRF